MHENGCWKMSEIPIVSYQEADKLRKTSWDIVLGNPENVRRD